MLASGHVRVNPCKDERRSRLFFPSCNRETKKCCYFGTLDFVRPIEKAPKPPLILVPLFVNKLSMNRFEGITNRTRSSLCSNKNPAPDKRQHPRPKRVNCKSDDNCIVVGSGREELNN